jgi:hypothetical protein
MKNAMHVEAVAPHINVFEIPADLLDRLHRATDAELRDWPDLLQLKRDHPFPAASSQLAKPPFNGVLQFVQVTFNTPSGTFAVSDADMWTMITYTSWAQLPINLYVSQYGNCSAIPDRFFIKFSVNLNGNTYTDQNLQTWVDTIFSQNLQHAGVPVCVVIPNPLGIVNNNATFSSRGGIGGYHSHTKQNNVYIFINMYGQNVTVQDSNFLYAGQLSHEIAEMVVDPIGGNPEVCDPCGPNCTGTPLVYLNFFNGRDVWYQYLGSFQGKKAPPLAHYDYFINAIVQPASSNLCPPGDLQAACAYAPPKVGKEDKDPKDKEKEKDKDPKDKDKEKEKEKDFKDKDKDSKEKEKERGKEVKEKDKDKEAHKEKEHKEAEAKSLKDKDKDMDAFPQDLDGRLSEVSNAVNQLTARLVNLEQQSAMGRSFIRPEERPQVGTAAINQLVTRINNLEQQLASVRSHSNEQSESGSVPPSVPTEHKKKE